MRIALGALAFLIASTLASGDQPAPITPPNIHTFRPSANGFAFVNHFQGTPLPGGLGAIGEGIGKSLGAPSTFGLCGGMSFAAADLFLAGRTPPTRATQPTRGQPLYEYIQSRQITSVGANMSLAGTFGRWMGLPDNGPLGTRRLSIVEIDELAASLEAGKPAVIGLVFNRHPGNIHSTARSGTPWENHQVLAYDLTRDDTTRTIEFRIYDPNYPKDDAAVIRCRAVGTDMMLVAPWGGWSVPVMGYLCERRVTGSKPGQNHITPVRGVLAMPYDSIVPPQGLD
jgi:hypothetical protein